MTPPQVLAGLLCLLVTPAFVAQAFVARAAAAAPRIVAAEAVYADIARQIAGPDATVTTLLNNPAADPHDFEPTPATARAVADADIAIANGLGYDPWMARLLAASSHAERAIVVADLLHRQDGANPHLWYDPAAMPALATSLANALRQSDPPHAAAITVRLTSTLASLATLQARITRLRAQDAGTQTAATEPVFGLMAAALGLTDRHTRLELSQMNGTEPRASDVAALQDDLRARRVRMLFVSAQHTGPATAQLAAIARAAGIPVLPIAETLPPGTTAQAWIGATLDAVQAALGKPS